MADEDAKIDITIFQQKLMDDLKLENMSEAQKIELEDKIGQLVNDRITNMILVYLPKEKIKEFADLSEMGDSEKLMAFATANIPSFEDKIFQELIQIRDEIVGRMSSK